MEPSKFIDQILHFRQGNRDKMVIKDGNVGIGTNSPKIHLAIGDSDTDWNNKETVSYDLHQYRTPRTTNSATLALGEQS